MSTLSPLSLPFDNSYARELPGFYVAWKPAQVPAPRLLYFNTELSTALGLDAHTWSEAALAASFSGNTLPEGAQPIAQAYAGHQFGNFSPQLGDGRALLLGEVIDRAGQRRDITLKGSGRTPFSRGGDGKAAIGPMLREVLIGEAMHALGIPTTRALAVVATGEPVFREQVLPGAVLTRVAASHLRVGTFEYFLARRELGQLRQLADYAIARHDSDLIGAPDRYLRLLRAVGQRQAQLVAAWMNVGFIHGVMNTDNMTISGETIDYGPCAFLEAYDPATVFSAIDQHGRYAFGNQPLIAQWNLARLAECLLPLIADDPEQAIEPATAVIDAFPDWYAQALASGQRAKLGLRAIAGHDATDQQLAADWLELLHAAKVDFTLAWRRLADAALGNTAPLRELFGGPLNLHDWLARWQTRCALENCDEVPDEARHKRAAQMRAVNPWIIPRNYRVEEALTAASDQNDLAPFTQLLNALRRPYVEEASSARYAAPAPVAVTAAYRTYCGT